MHCDCTPPDIYDQKIVKTRKPHQCIECHMTIPVGDKASRVKALYDGQFSTFYTCLECKQIVDYLQRKTPKEELCCHGELYQYLWDCTYIYSDEAIEDEALSWLPDHEGIIRGRHSRIAPIVPWLTLRIAGKFRLVESYAKDLPDPV